MNIAVRYYSKTGNTKAVAEAIARAVNVEAVSVEKPEAQPAQQEEKSEEKK